LDLKFRLHSRNQRYAFKAVIDAKDIFGSLLEHCRVQFRRSRFKTVDFLKWYYVMKTTPIFALCSLSAAAQGTAFVDLNFENANRIAVSRVPFQVGQLPVGQAIPGWSVEIGGTPQTLVGLNQVGLTGASASLYYTGTTDPFLGDFSFTIRAGSDFLNPQILDSTSLFQSGLIPTGVHSIQFYGRFGPSLDYFHVSLGGRNLTLVALQPMALGYIFGADISQFAGQYEQLRFTVDPGAQIINPGRLILDNITFSPNVISPEPSSALLSTLGVTALILLRPKCRFSARQHRLM
jgi:hypothetical protein